MIEYLRDFRPRRLGVIEAPDQLVKRAHQKMLRLPLAIVVPEFAIHDLGNRRGKLGLRRQAEKPAQLVQIVGGVVEPRFIFDDARREIP